MVILKSAEHYAIVAASRQDYEGFYEEEIAYRDLLRYPPIAHMMSVQIMSSDEGRGMQFATMLHAIMEQQGQKGAVFIGPAAAAIGKINDVYRMAVYVKMDDYQGLITYKDLLEKYIRGLEDIGQMKGISVQFDFDPVNGF